ncbi:MAG TPA: hypothetical protein VLN74_00370 [Ilumatobacteraceae bacterium]|nr:hypothetical protein [Ilumatobacteraceae bacterium]
MRKTLVSALLCGVAAAGVTAGSLAADGVPIHDHFLVKSNGDRIQIGPRVCANHDLHGAFHNFHEHVHTGSPTGKGGLTIRPVFCAPAG